VPMETEYFSLSLSLEAGQRAATEVLAALGREGPSDV